MAANTGFSLSRVCLGLTSAPDDVLPIDHPERWSSVGRYIMRWQPVSERNFVLGAKGDMKENCSRLDCTGT